MKDFLTSKEAAQMLGVTPGSIRNWVDEGRLAAFTTPGGHRRLLISDLEQFAHQKGIPLTSSSPIKKRILVVDDDVRITGWIKELLTQYIPENQIEIASDGFEAGVKVVEFLPQIILLDLLMPGLDGFSACRLIKTDARTKDARIIAMTGYPTDENIERIFKAGAEACLKKPFSSQELIDLLGIQSATKHL